MDNHYVYIRVETAKPTIGSIEPITNIVTFIFYIGFVYAFYMEPTRKNQCGICMNFCLEYMM